MLTRASTGSTTAGVSDMKRAWTIETAKEAANAVVTVFRDHKMITQVEVWTPQPVVVNVCEQSRVHLDDAFRRTRYPVGH